MKLSQFKFKLPENLVALEPSYHRDECRLMVIHRKSGRIETTKKDENGEDMLDEEGKPVFLDFRNVLDYFDEEDISGVRSSWLTFATNSRRVCSFFRCSVTSWIRRSNSGFFLSGSMFERRPLIKLSMQTT